MFAYDQAAWHATDRFKEDLAKGGWNAERLRSSGLRGYIIEPEDDGRLRVSFYGIRNGQAVALSRYLVAAGTPIKGGLVGPDSDSAMSLLAIRMIAARDSALQEMAKPDHQICSATPPNTIVLPPRPDGVLPVYILTSTNQADVYPAGGHYRFDFDPSGKLIGQRRFMKSCFPLNLRGKKDESVTAIVLSHLLDPLPTEVHVFVSLNIPVPLMVLTTANSQMWSVAHGQITTLGRIPDR